MKVVVNGKECEIGGGVTMEQVQEAIREAVSRLKTEEVYSTEETRIGTWIDGKPLYRRTFVSKTPTSTNVEWVVLSANDWGIGEVVNLYGVVMGVGDIDCSVPLNFFIKDNLHCSAYYKGNSFYSFVGNAAYAGKNMYVTVEYTKTTD